MRRLLLLAMALCGLIPSAAGQSTGASNGYCTGGGVSATTQGLPSTNKLQGVIPSCTITVYLHGTTTLATIYTDPASDPLANPFTATSAGFWQFYAANNATYDVFGSGGVAPNTYPTPTLIPGSGAASAVGLYLPLAGGTLYGALFAPNVNGEIYPAQCGSSTPPSWCSGTTADAWYRAACTQLPSTGGVINLLGLSGTIANSMVCSTPTKQVITLQDPTMRLTVTESDGATVFPLDNSSMFVGPGAGQCDNSGGVRLASTANVAAIVGPARTDQTQEAFTANGLCLLGAFGATVGQALIYTKNTFANTTIDDNNVFVCNTACVKVVNGSDIEIANNWLNVADGVNTITGVPLILQGGGLGTGCNIAMVNVRGGQMEHALGGGPEIQVIGDGAGALACSISIRDVGVERNTAGTPSTIGIKIQDCQGCTVENILSTGSAGGADMVNISQTANARTQNVVLLNINNIFAPYANTVNDTTTTGKVLTSFASPQVTTYYSNPGYTQPPVLPGTVIQSLGSDTMAGLGSFVTGSGTFGTGFGATGCLFAAGLTCTYTRTNSTAPPNYTYSQQMQISANTSSSVGYNGIQYGTPVSFTAGQPFSASFWGKGDGTFTGIPTFLLWNSVTPIVYCLSTTTAPFTTTWTLYSFTCTPSTSGSSYLTVAALTPFNQTGTVWFGDFIFSPIIPLAPGNLLASVAPYGIGPSTATNSAATNPLPTCNAGSQGNQHTVSDATSPTYMAAYSSGGAVTAAVICSYNGTTYSWLTH